ncbi:hypothetical protein J437_LFUL009044 [Ladona fulva]|uniref:Protein prenyltransferase alpha subunit repeat-containing protein 1 n=1 Tax=Ladona fulva TaxID=123851 RepID=A0A8K0K5H3_LADFU|nr:hypothetical protein J437_LFUL009044 [Ladona fulva]
MQDNPFPAADRILADIEAVFKKDPELAEFDIVPVNENQNKSPVLHCSHSLGLESWCVRHVYCYIYQRLMDLRKNRKKEDPAVLIRLLRGALLLNPDVASFWHMRKDLVLSSQLDPISDLHFSAIVLSYKPKCSEAFSHRRWLLSQLFKIEPYATSMASTISARYAYSPMEALEVELKVSGLAASRYANNYHAWNHRIWTIQHICARTSTGKVLLREWRYSGDWVTCHVSDHSGMQYRQFLLQQLISLSSAIDGDYSGVEEVSSCNGKLLSLSGIIEVLKAFRESCDAVEDGFYIDFKGAKGQVGERFLSFVVSELLFNTDLICRFVGHEALWCHRRFIVTTLFKLAEKFVRNAYEVNVVDQLLKAIQKQEELLVRHCTESIRTDIHQVRFAKRHALWLARSLNMSLMCNSK